MAEAGQETERRNMASERGWAGSGGRTPLLGIRLSGKGEAHFPGQILRVSNQLAVAR